VSGSPATLTLSGAASRSTSTDASGKYSFTSLPNGSYIVAPSQSGYSFSPATSAVTINGASNTSVNFVASAVAAPVPHSVTLSWTPSTSTNLKGYNVYRAATAGGAFAKINASTVTGTAYTDSTVASGRTYYYVTTAVNTSNLESGYSNQATAVVPSP
jgi:fibronectin type 3 domain-containing protein